MALRAGAEGGVEGEAARLQLGDVEAAIGTGHGGREELLLGFCAAAGEGDEDQAIGQLQGLGDGGFEALFHGGFAGEVLAFPPLAARIAHGDLPGTPCVRWPFETADRV